MAFRHWCMAWWCQKLLWCIPLTKLESCILWQACVCSVFCSRTILWLSCSLKTGRLSQTSSFISILLAFLKPNSELVDILNMKLVSPHAFYFLWKTLVYVFFFICLFMSFLNSKILSCKNMPRGLLVQDSWNRSWLSKLLWCNHVWRQCFWS